MKNEFDTLETPILQLVESEAPKKVFVAYSGGVDSSALLAILAGLKAKKRLSQPIGAIHINHNLQDEADLWAAHCRLQCEKLGVAIKVVSIKVDKTAASLEAQARSARYAAFTSILAEQDALFLAQHQDDQVETVFLRLLRGAGAHGLSAMHAVRKLENGILLRPWLEIPKTQIMAYAQSSNFEWVEDKSNQDIKMDRNFLRHEIIPRLKTRWPSLNKTVSRTAKLLKTSSTDFDFINNELLLTDLDHLEPDVAVGRVYQWLRNLKAPMPSYKIIMNIVTQLVPAAEDAIPQVDWNGGQVRRYAGKLYYFKDKKNLVQIDFSLNITGAELIAIANQQQNLTLKSYAKLNLKTSEIKGIRVLVEDKISIKFAQGAEKIKPLFGQHTKKLKKIFQENKIPPWQRRTVPLIYINDNLAQVVGICVAASFAQSENEMGVYISRLS